MVPIEKIKDVMHYFKVRNYQCYLVGGCVRDKLLGKEPKDYDLVTDATPEQVHQIIDEDVQEDLFVGYSNISNNSEKYGVTMPLVDGTNGLEQIEITTMRRDITKGRHPSIEYTTDINEDAMRRDFTINALYEDIDGNILDPTGLGKSDIESRTLRFVGSANARITEDPLRAYRLIRFASTLGFQLDIIDLPTDYMGHYDIDYSEVSRERKLIEFKKMLEGKYFNEVDCFKLMNNFNIFMDLKLDQMLFSDMIKCTQNPTWHAEGDVLSHTLMVIHQMANFTDHDWIDMLVAMLHDCGKYQAGIENGNKPGTDYMNTNGHDELGATIAYNICKSLGLSNKECEDIEWLVLHHMDAHHLFEMKSKCKIWKIVTHPLFNRLVRLAICDERGCIQIKENEWIDMPTTLIKVPNVASAITDLSVSYGKFITNTSNYAVTRYPEITKISVNTIELPEPILTGTYLIGKGHKPNDSFKKALDVAYKLQIDQNMLDIDLLYRNVKNLIKKY
jgi:tRNA nucleotidyltransferase/poly(A) polymerase